KAHENSPAMSTFDGKPPSGLTSPAQVDRAADRPQREKSLSDLHRHVQVVDCVQAVSCSTPCPITKSRSTASAHSASSHGSVSRIVDASPSKFPETRVVGPFGHRLPTSPHNSKPTKTASSELPGSKTTGDPTWWSRISAKPGTGKGAQRYWGGSVKIRESAAPWARPVGQAARHHAVAPIPESLMVMVHIVRKEVPGARVTERAERLDGHRY